MSAAPGQRAKNAVRGADTEDGLDRIAQAGLVAYGIVHLVLAWTAVQLALGDRGSSGEASAGGALREMAQQPFGAVLIWTVAIGLLLLVAWRVYETVAGHTDESGSDRTKKRIGSGVKAGIYAVVAFLAFRVATGSGGGGGGGSSSEETITARLMSVPAGQVLVVAIGLVIIGYGVYHAYKGFSSDHAEHLTAEGKSGETGRAYLAFGTVGYVAKGVAAGLVGVLFVVAGATHDAEEAAGLDEALRQLLEAPFGPYIVGAVGVGIACYGLFCLARARHLSR